MYVFSTFLTWRHSLPHFWGVSILFAFGSIGILKNNTRKKRAGELSFDLSSATNCGTIHKHLNLFNKYVNEPFLHVRSRRYQNI